MSQPSSGDDRESWHEYPPHRTPLRPLFVIVPLILAVLAVGAIFAINRQASPNEDDASARSDCDAGGNICISEFRLSGEDGKLPTEQQFRERMPVNDRLALVWQLSVARSFQPVTLPVTSEYLDLMIFSGCTGGGKLTVTVRDGSSTMRAHTVACDGVIPVGLGITVAVLGATKPATPEPLGPFTFELSPQGNVTDAEFFVQGRVPLGAP